SDERALCTTRPWAHQLPMIKTNWKVGEKTPPIARRQKLPTGVENWREISACRRQGGRHEIERHSDQPQEEQGERNGTAAPNQGRVLTSRRDEKGDPQRRVRRNECHGEHGPGSKSGKQCRKEKKAEQQL